MKFFFAAIINAVLLLSVTAELYLPHRPQNYGPLYQGIRQLLHQEKLSAEQIWNETQIQIIENSEVLKTAQVSLYNYARVLNEKLAQLNEMGKSEESRHCYKQYERQVAHFNRDLIYKYRQCSQSLNASLSQLQEEIVSEIHFIHLAAMEIQELTYLCNVTLLKRANRGNHESVTMCVVTQLGLIHQHMFEAAQICLDIIDRMNAVDIGTENSTDGSSQLVEGGAIFENDFGSGVVCLDFQDLKDQFETIYDLMMECVEQENFK